MHCNVPNLDHLPPKISIPPIVLTVHILRNVYFYRIFNQGVLQSHDQNIDDDCQKEQRHRHVRQEPADRQMSRVSREPAGWVRSRPDGCLHDAAPEEDGGRREEP